MVFSTYFGNYNRRLLKNVSLVLVPVISVSYLSIKKKSSLSNIQAESSGLPPFKVQYLIIGSGPTAYSALRTIRYLEPSSKVLIATDSKYLPYERYPLNMEAWFTDNFSETFEYESRFQASNKFLFFQPESFYLSPTDLESADEYGAQALLLKHKFSQIDPEKHLARLENGDSVQYEKCLLALGSKTPTLPTKIPASLKKKFHVLDNLDDFHSLTESLANCSHIGIIGDNLKAVEFATCQSLIFNNEVKRKVTLTCSGKFLADYLPQIVIDWLKPEIEKLGVKIIENAKVGNLVVSNQSGKLKLNFGTESFCCDNVVSMLPRIANSELAKNSALETDSDNLDTIVTDSTLKVRSDLYAAGSCVSVYHPMFRSRLSFDFPDHSVMSGRWAALNMIGKVMPYFKLPRHFADFGDDLGFDGVGLIDPKLETQVYFAHRSKTEQNENTADTELENTETLESKVDSKSTEIEAGNVTDKEEIETNQEYTNMESKTTQNQNPTASTEVEEKSNIDDDPIASCAVVYIKDGVVVGVVTLGSFGRMFIAENMISRKVKSEDVYEFVPLLLTTKFSIRKPSDEDEDGMF
ncbi:apoptosis-inducing factor 1, mitochondrial-like [Symsagittifera roscoffensis]|uniref:apoptosis-inducing factor 1, mitochondrial-like n=1 Tax=Symsagittifera roscoffensis TaxID=84072 RepID=UPI00307B3F24